jgi:flagellar hook-associated protein 1 FlgK
LNTFFSGTTAATMDITDYISNSTDGISHIAVSRTVSKVDNENVLAMGKVGDTVASGLGGQTPKEYYIRIVTSVGSQIEDTKLKEESSQIVWNNLSQQRNESSGVDMNIEATKMLTYERMFQAMAKYISVISQTMSEVMEIVI